MKYRGENREPRTLVLNASETGIATPRARAGATRHGSLAARR
jgi:hypothetical protein